MKFRFWVDVHSFHDGSSVNPLTCSVHDSLRFAGDVASYTITRTQVEVDIPLPGYDDKVHEGKVVDPDSFEAWKEDVAP